MLISSEQLLVIFLNIFGTVFMRDIGALLGLALAYFIKYEMDKRYVFKN